MRPPPRLTWINAVPAIVSRPGSPWAGRDHPQRHCSLHPPGLAPLLVATADRFEASTGIPVIETYYDRGRQPDHGALRFGVRRPARVAVSAGGGAADRRPGGVSRRVARGRAPAKLGTSRSAGDHGRAMMSRQHRDRFDAEGWLRTGDLGHRDADGYLYLDARTDDVINREARRFSRGRSRRSSASIPLSPQAVGEARNWKLGQVPVAFVALRGPDDPPAATPPRSVSWHARRRAVSRHPSSSQLVRSGRLVALCVVHTCCLPAPPGRFAADPSTLHEVPVLYTFDLVGATTVESPPSPAVTRTGNPRKRLDHIDAMRPVKQAGVVSTHTPPRSRAGCGGAGRRGLAPVAARHAGGVPLRSSARRSLAQQAWRDLPGVDHRTFWRGASPWRRLHLSLNRHLLLRRPPGRSRDAQSRCDPSAVPVLGTGYYQLYYLLGSSWSSHALFLAFSRSCLAGRTGHHGLVLLASGLVQIVLVPTMRQGLVPAWMQGYRATREGYLRSSPCLAVGWWSRCTSTSLR